MKSALLLLFLAYSKAAYTANFLQTPSFNHNNGNYNRNNDYHRSATRNVASQGATKYISDKDIRTLKSDQLINPDGSYSYSYQISNGIFASEKRNGDQVLGKNSYISPEGIEIKTTYVADETGYHAVGDHIPKTPDYILRALEYIKNHPYKVKDGSKVTTKKPIAHSYDKSAHYYQPTTRAPVYHSNIKNSYRLHKNGAYKNPRKY